MAGEINKEEMNGWIYIHLGNDAGFKAKKNEKPQQIYRTDRE